MRKIFIIGFIVVLAASFMNVFHGFSVPASPKIHVEPKQNFFTTETTSVGETFAINISTSGWEAPGLYSYEFKLYYDPTILEASDAGTPDDHFLAADNVFIVKRGEIHQDEGYVWFSVTLLGDEPAKTGGGAFGYVTFTITAAPPPLLSCNLELRDIIFVDGDGNTVEEYEVTHGYYEFMPPKPPVYLKVTPETSSAKEVGDEVNVDVTINEVETTLRLVGVEFKLRYNITLLETKKEWVTIPMADAQSQVIVENDHVFVSVLLEFPPGIFPEGSGTLANIKFNVTYVPPTLTTSELILDDVILTDVDGNVIPYDRLEHGTYRVPLLFEREDVNQDGKINIEDIVVWALAFGSDPDHPRWNPIVDLDSNGVISILDGIMIAKNFGKT